MLGSSRPPYSAETGTASRSRKSQVLSLPITRRVTETCRPTQSRILAYKLLQDTLQSLGSESHHVDPTTKGLG